jgi:transposase-like protein
VADDHAGLRAALREVLAEAAYQRCYVHFLRNTLQVVRIFPNGESCLRLVPALAVETHENWLEQHRYLNMDDLREHKKEALRRAA